MSAKSTVAAQALTSSLIFKALIVIMALLAITTAISLQAPHLLESKKHLTDYNAFYTAGALANEGRAATAYNLEQMFIEMNKGIEDKVKMPWTYPPVFTLLLQGFSALDLGWSYLLFIALSGGLFLWTIKKITPAYCGAILFFLPALVVNIRSGQNGLLTAALVGLFLIAFLQRQSRAGLPLGLMIIKPHLAVAISLLSLLGRRWSAMAIAAAVVILSLTLATLVYSPSIWPAFMAAVKEAGELLGMGAYTLNRMSSVYAFVRSLGVPAQISMLIHAAFAITGLALLVYAWFKKMPPARLGALSCAVSVFISPYNYDYDLMILCIGMALVFGDLLARATGKQIAWLFGGYWLATGIGWLSQSALTKLETDILGRETAVFETSLIAPLLLIMLVATARILARPVTSQTPA